MKINKLHLALQWIVFLPIILPLCIVFGAIQGIFDTLEDMFYQMRADVSENTTDSIEL